MALLDNLDLNYTPAGVQTLSGMVFYIFIGMFVAGFLIFLVIQLFKILTYNIHATVYKKVGNSFITIPDKVKKVKVEDAQLYHYRKLNLYSPVFNSDYNNIVKTSMLGMPQTAVGFTVFLYGEKIVPAVVQGNDKIEPIDYDAWNYLVQRTRINQAKYERNQQLMRMLPFVGLMFVVVAFIIGSILWGKHVENVATMILDKTQQFFSTAAQASGKVQVIT